MFRCNVCANTPFGLIFGQENHQPLVQRRISTIRRNADLSSISSSDDSIPGTALPTKRTVDDTPNDYQHRTPNDIQIKFENWKVYLHPRANDLWSTNAESHIKEILELVATFTDKKDDPIMGDEYDCVVWHGEYNKSESGIETPAVTLRKNVAESQTKTSLLRTLTFMFVDDDSFDLIFKAAVSVIVSLYVLFQSNFLLFIRTIRRPNSKHLVRTDDV